VSRWLLVALLMLAIAAPARAGLGPVAAEGRIEVLFSPHDAVEARLIALIGGARQSIHVQMYVFTRKAIAQALVAAQARGVQVRVLADARQNQRGQNALPILLAAGVPVALETAYRSAHHKLMLIDATRSDAVVVTGSYNFSWSAGSKNAENVIVLYGNRPVAKAYLANWTRHAAEATLIHHLPQQLVD
jgi:phosphatidylserine/phosphatidylglycerophosphate/cardiolipin synthase-like enzyme